MYKTPTALDTCEISPVRINNKHHATPHRNTRKTSRRDHGIDVHTSCSTPTQLSPGLANRSLNSPSSSFPYSQDNCPDVVWDYTSPKLPRGARKKEIKLTVKELLENLNQCQVPESNTQSAQYIKLLENYMAKQSIDSLDFAAKRTEKSKKGNKKGSRHAIEKLKKFLETIPRTSKDSECSINSRQSDNSRVEDTTDTNNLSKLNISAKSFLEGESSECDSTEELWGETDNSFIVKATQELDSINPICTITNNAISQEVISTIPETVSSPKTPKRSSNNKRPSCENRPSLDLDKYNDFLEQLTNVNWDSDVDCDEWDNGFIEDEDDALSMIPDDVLTGTVQWDDERTAIIGTLHKQNDGMVSQSEKNTVIHDTFSGDTVIYSMRGSNPHFDLEKSRVQVSNEELYNSFEDESFEDESLLCQPDVLSKIDEVENMLSQHPKYTPEEIEKKKDEAIKRRQMTGPGKKPVK